MQHTKADKLKLCITNKLMSSNYAVYEQIHELELLFDQELELYMQYTQIDPFLFAVRYEETDESGINSGSLFKFLCTRTDHIH